jgi:Sigma-70, region 4
VIHHRFGIGMAEAEAPGASADSGASRAGARGKTPDPLTLEQVGQIIGVTKERVRQIQNKALEKIRLFIEENSTRADEVTGDEEPVISSN